jgi:hypothetical protein
MGTDGVLSLPVIVFGIENGDDCSRLSFCVERSGSAESLYAVYLFVVVVTLYKEGNGKEENSNGISETATPHPALSRKGRGNKKRKTI